jgi:hypothetical protein
MVSWVTGNQPTFIRGVQSSFSGYLFPFEDYQHWLLQDITVPRWFLSSWGSDNHYHIYDPERIVLERFD